MLYRKDDECVVNKLKRDLIDIDRVVLKNIFDFTSESTDGVKTDNNVNGGYKIAVSGKICSGKTSFTNILKEEIGNIRRVSVAAKLKWLANKLYGMSLDPEKKDRKLLQTLGVKLREQDPNVWVNTFLKECEKYENVMCDDVRFKNEIDTVKEDGFVTIRLDISDELQKERITNCYPENYKQHLDNRHHISETDLDEEKEKFDYILHVDRYSLDDIRQFIRENILK